MLPTAADYQDAELGPLLTEAQRIQVGNTPEGLDRALRDGLPEEVAARLPAGALLHHELCRPTALALDTLGVFDARGGWTPYSFWDRKNCRLTRSEKGSPSADHVAVHHKSSADLLGFPLLDAAQGLGRKKPIRGLGRIALDLVTYTGAAADGTTGLRVARAFWGVDVHLKLDDRDAAEQAWTAVFSDPQGEQPLLHGYHIDTEGVQLRPDSARLDEFLDGETLALQRDGPRSRWLHGQFFRYLLTARFAAAGLSAYACGPLADLLIAANDDPALAERLKAQRTQFAAAGFTQLVLDTHRQRLPAHALLTPQKVRALAEQVEAQAFAEAFRRSLQDVADAGKFRGYLRSLVLHGLALSLQELFVLHGRGDERQALIHARLPIQFGDRADDPLSVFESGDHGDGTARTFVKHLAEALATWQRGELADCAYAAEDALVELLFEQERRHAGWRRLAPDDPRTLPRIGRELTGTSAVAQVHLQALRRVLFQAETVGADRFEVYDLHREIRTVRRALEARARPPGQPPRRPTAWELVSAAVAAAQDGRAFPTLAGLLAAYEKLTAGLGDGAPSAEARLADQIYRLSASLCVDGCRACLHRRSTLMPDAQATSAVSRDLLRRYREFVLAPLTLSISQRLPDEAALQKILTEHGALRLLVDPIRYDTLEPELRKRGFEEGTFDPLLLAVICVRTVQ
jgi:hypothetical protein